MQTHTRKALTPENITPKLLFQSKKAYAYMYIIITFHISSKIPFPSVVILLRRSNGCIMPLWQAQLPPYPITIIQRTPPPHPSASVKLLKNQSNDVKICKMRDFSTHLHRKWQSKATWRLVFSLRGKYEHCSRILLEKCPCACGWVGVCLWGYVTSHKTPIAFPGSLPRSMIAFGERTRRDE